MVIFSALLFYNTFQSCKFLTYRDFFYKNAQEQSTTRHWWDNDELSRSGKYKNTIKGNDSLFKTKNGFKNACHLIMCHTLDKRKKTLPLVPFK